MKQLNRVAKVQTLLNTWLNFRFQEELILTCRLYNFSKKLPGNCIVKNKNERLWRIILRNKIILKFWKNFTSLKNFILNMVRLRPSTRPSGRVVKVLVAESNGRWFKSSTLHKILFLNYQFQNFYLPNVGKSAKRTNVNLTPCTHSILTPDTSICKACH